MIVDLSGLRFCDKALSQLIDVYLQLGQFLRRNIKLFIFTINFSGLSICLFSVFSFTEKNVMSLRLVTVKGLAQWHCSDATNRAQELNLTFYRIDAA